MEEWQNGHDKFSKAKQKQLAKNRERLIAEHRGKETVKVTTNAFAVGWERIWGKQKCY